MAHQLTEDKPVPQLKDNVIDMFSLKGKVCVVAGAGSGIGLAACRAYLDAGAEGLAMLYNSNAKTIELAKELEKEFNNQTKIIAYQCPVNESSKVKETVEKIVADFGKLDVFVANAGMGAGGAITEMSDEYFNKTTAVNFSGVFYCAREAGKQFKKQGNGSFIITASMSGHIVNVPLTQALYNAHKSGVRHLGKSLAVEWKDFARSNIISPGFFYTDMGAAPEVAATARNMAVLGRQGDTRELKGIFLYFASDASTFTTGADILVDGGYTLS